MKKSKQLKPKPDIDEELSELLAMSPWERTRAYQEGCEPSTEHIIDGVLIGFKYILERRGGHLDFITAKQAKKEIKDLIVSCGGKIVP